MAAPKLDSIAAHGAQVLVAAGGGWVFHQLGIPAAWLSGSVLAVVAWGLTGLARPMPRPMVDAAMLVSGATMGAGVTPEAVAAVVRYPLSLLTLAVGVVAITAASTLWLTRVSGWRRDDALLASVPGALSTVLAVAADRNAAVPAIAVVQAIRLFIIVALLPSVVVLIGGDGRGLLGKGQALASPLGLLLVLLGGVLLGGLFERLRIAAPLLLGGTVVSVAFHATGWAPGGMPPVFAAAGLVLIGIYIAERFRTLDRAALIRTIPAALGSFAVGMGVASLFAAIAAAFARVGLADALVAFAPGGLEAMMVLALVLGLDPLYVGIHHLARFLGIGLLLPLIFTWLGPTRRG